jgi:hypothetical protein
MLGLFRGGVWGARLTAWRQGAVRGGLPVLRILLSVGNIVFSLILGALLMAFTAIYAPETLSMMLDWARSFKALITGTGLDAKYNIWLQLLLEERQLLLMFFTIIARIILAIVAYPIVLLREKT